MTVQAQIGDVADTVRGVTYDKQDASMVPVDGYVPLLRATNIEPGCLNFDGLVYVPPADVAEEQLLRPGDIVLASSSGSLSVVGKAAALQTAWRGTFGAFCAVVRPRPGIVPGYLAYFMQTSDYRGRISALAAGVNINNLRREHIEGIDFPLVDEGHQRSIVEAVDEYLTRLDAAVASLERVRAKLRAFRASVLKSAMEGRLVPTEAELAQKEGRDYEPASVLLARVLAERRRRWEAAELAGMRAAGRAPKDHSWKAKYVEPAPPNTTGLPALPTGWCWARAEQISEFITKGTTPEKSAMTAGSGDIPYIKVYNLTFDGSLNFSLDPTFVDVATHKGFLGRSSCVPGDVLMNIVGPPLGKVSIVPDSHEQWNINQAIARYRPIAGIDARFLAATLLCPSTLRWASTRAKATAGQFNLTLEIARDLPIPVAPAAEQARVVEELERQETVQRAIESSTLAERRRLSRLRQAVLKWAFEGKLVDQDPNDEPAEKLLARIRAERAATPSPKALPGRKAKK